MTVQKHHISLLTETRTNGLDEIMQILPWCNVYSGAALANCIGKKGFGVVAVMTSSNEIILSRLRAIDTLSRDWGQPILIHCLIIERSLWIFIL